MGLVNLGMLAGLAALGIPVLVHLVYGRRARPVQLGTLRFLKIVLQENVRRRRLKRWLLLALRMICVALVVLLFARPYLVAQDSGGEQRLVILLIDRSASMGLKSDGLRLLDVAIREANKIVAECGEGTQIEAAWFDHAVHTFCGETGDPGTTIPANLADQLTALGSAKVLYGGTDYGASMAWARDVAAQSHRARKELYVFTDLQRSGFDRTAASPLPEDLHVHLEALGRAYPDNVAVTAAPSKAVVRPGEPVTVTAALRNTAAFARETVPVVLRLAGRAVAEDRPDGRRRTIEPANRAAKEFHSQARLEAGGTAEVRFELPALPEGLWQGEVKAEIQDDLAFDNQCPVAFLIAPPLGVLVVDGAAGASPVASETYFLETAIGLADHDPGPSAGPFAAVTVPYDPAAGLPDLRNKTSLVVLTNVASLSGADARRLAEFVRGGGGLLVFTGENVQADGCRAMAAEGLCPGQIGSIVRADALEWRLVEYETEHPVFSPFSDPQYGDLRRPAFHAYTRIRPSAEAKILARFRGGDPAVLEKKLGSGKVLWVATTCGLGWSDWPRSKLFLPMIHQMLGYLSGLTEGGPVRVSSLDRQEGVEPVPGIFAREGFCEVVHTDPRESEGERVTPEQFAARFHFQLSDRLSGEDESASSAATAQAAGDRFRPAEIWPWVILGLFGFQLAEVFLANRTTA